MTRDQFVLGAAIVLLSAIAACGGSSPTTSTPTSPTASTSPPPAAPPASPPTTVAPPPATPPACVVPFNHRQAMGTMTATIDGTPWSAECITVSRDNQTLTVAGTNPRLPSNGSSILIVGAPLNQIGTFTDARANGRVSILEGSIYTVSDWFGRGTGAVSVSTATSTAAAGTFSFTTHINVRDGVEITTPRVVTNGAFNITF